MKNLGLILIMFLLVGCGKSFDKTEDVEETATVKSEIYKTSYGSEIETIHNEGYDIVIYHNHSNSAGNDMELIYVDEEVMEGS